MEHKSAILHGARILVVEDEPLIAMELGETITEAGGLIAASTRSRREALNFLDKLDIDAAILDVRLADGLCFGVADKLKAKGIPFVFCTADNDTHPEFIEWPGVPVITKPHKPQAVIAALSRLLGDFKVGV